MAFERLVVVDRVLDGERRVDLGRLAEDLMFYEEVRIHVGRGELADLVSGVGAEALLELMARDALKVAYANNVVGARTHTSGVISYYEPVLMTTERLALERTAHEVFSKFEKDESKVTKQVARFVELAENRPHDVQICDATRDFLDDAEAVERAVRTVLTLDGALPSDHPEVRFRPERQDKGLFTVDTNIAFDKLNDGQHRVRGPLDPARLIAFFASMRSKLMLASEHAADLDTNAIDAALLTSQVEELLSRRAQSTDTLFQLQRMTLRDGNAIAQAINHGERNFRDLLAVLDKSQRFRAWLRAQDPEAELLHEYYREATDETWISTLPAKAFRWLIATMGGAAIAGTPGIVVGAAIGAIDTFLLDKLAAGWRPSQFVDDDLRKFVGADEAPSSG